MPAYWNTVQLGTLLKSINRSETVQSNRIYRLVGVRWYGEGAHIHSVKRGSDIATNSLSQIHENDILYNKMWTSKIAFAVVKKEQHGGYVTNEYPQFRVDESKLDINFFEQVFSRPRFTYDAITLTRGTTERARLNPKDFIKIEINLPPLKEQKKIAEILGTWDETIRLTKELIAAKQQRKKALMQQLLPGKVRFHEFTDNWKYVKLRGILSEAKLGGNYKNSETFNGYPLIKMGNLGRGRINLSKVAYIPADGEYNSDHFLKYDDILFNTRNTLGLVGKVSIWKNELPKALFNSNILRMYFNTDYVSSNDFMNYYFNSHEGLRQLKRLAIGTTSVAAIYSRDLMKVNVLLPNLKEQKKIAEVLSACDEEIHLLQQKADALRTQKKGLMQQLLTGKTRVSE